jgi:hypothetical protein
MRSSKPFRTDAGCLQYIPHGPSTRLLRHKSIVANVTNHNQDRAIVLEVSHRLPTAAARFRAHVRLCGLLRLLRFPYQLSFQRLLDTQRLSSGDVTIDQSVACRTPPQETKKITTVTISLFPTLKM